MFLVFLSFGVQHDFLCANCTVFCLHIKCAKLKNIVFATQFWQFYCQQVNSWPPGCYFYFTQCQDVTFECPVPVSIIFFFLCWPKWVQVWILLYLINFFYFSPFHSLLSHSAEEAGVQVEEREAVQPAIRTSFSLPELKGWMFWKCPRPKREMREICWFANGAEVVKNIQHTVHNNTPAPTSFFSFCYLLYAWTTCSPLLSQCPPPPQPLPPLPSFLSMHR